MNIQISGANCAHLKARIYRLLHCWSPCGRCHVVKSLKFFNVFHPFFAFCVSDFLHIANAIISFSHKLLSLCVIWAFWHTLTHSDDLCSALKFVSKIQWVQSQAESYRHVAFVTLSSELWHLLEFNKFPVWELPFSAWIIDRSNLGLTKEAI